MKRLLLALCIYLGLTQGLIAQDLPEPSPLPLRGMEMGEDFRLGPVIHTGLSLGLETPGDRQYYLFELRGESPNHGFSRLFVRLVSLYELLELATLNVAENAPVRTVRFHHQFFTLGLESPLFYELTSPLALEWGWTGGFTMAKATFKEPQKTITEGFQSFLQDYPEIQPGALGQQKVNPAQADAQFAGAEVGQYVRYYGWYPFVPYASVRALPGLFLDTNALIKGVEQKPTPTTVPTPVPSASASPTFQREIKSGFQLGATGSIGLEAYLGTRGLVALEYTLWNWDWFNRPEDASHFLVLKAGFLF